MLECQFLYTCSICGDVAFNSLPELEQHMAVHDNHSAGNTTVAADALPPTELENSKCSLPLFTSLGALMLYCIH